MKSLMAARIGLEVMDLGSACRTYNILVAEHRTWPPRCSSTR
jgi:uncharacterized protein